MQINKFHKPLFTNKSFDMRENKCAIFEVQAIIGKSAPVFHRLDQTTGKQSLANYCGEKLMKADVKKDLLISPAEKVSSLSSAASKS